MSEFDAVFTNIRPSGGDTGARLNLRHRLELISKFVDLQSAKFLDCGCGNGQYVEAFREMGVNIYGVEYSAEKVEQFQERHPGTNWVSAGDIEHLDISSQSFDAVLLNEVLEHVPDDRQALREVYRILKPKGFLIVFSPNRFYPFETHGVYLKKTGQKLPSYFPFIPYIPLRLARNYFNFVARNYWPRQLRRRVIDTGFSVVHLAYMWPTFENISEEQPLVIRIISPILRQLAARFEKLPVLRTFGVSQAVIAQRQ